MPVLGVTACPPHDVSQLAGSQSDRGLPPSRTQAGLILPSATTAALTLAPNPALQAAQPRLAAPRHCQPAPHLLSSPLTTLHLTHCTSSLCRHTLLLCRQQSQGLLPPGTAYDLFRGTAASQRDEVEAYPASLAAKVTFGAKTHPEVAVFSPDGTMLVSGSSDGFIEVGVLLRLMLTRCL
eukprot:GHRQ01028991.1.p1 GENE.GHRQ01028991.1~~GHRQ01028991.1.p1  ORF type:complete len:180 (+),score=43.94 GHRQ01028991.1:93-632(+)